MARLWIHTGLVAACAIALYSSDVRAADDGIRGELEQAAETTPEEKVRFVERVLEEMKGAVRETGKLLESAEKSKDVVRMQCLNQKLTSIRALLAVSEQATGAMQNALVAAEGEKADHEFRKIAVALSKVRQFNAEADACLGAVGTQPGAIEIEVEEGEVLAGDADDTEPMEDGNTDIGIDPPGTSPFE